MPCTSCTVGTAAAAERLLRDPHLVAILLCFQIVYCLASTSARFGIEDVTVSVILLAMLSVADCRLRKSDSKWEFRVALCCAVRSVLLLNLAAAP